MNVRDLLHNALLTAIVIFVITLTVTVIEIKNCISRQKEVDYNIAQQSYYDMQTAKYRAQAAEARYKVQEAQLRLFLKRNNTTLEELDLEGD